MKDSNFAAIMAMLFFIASSINNKNIPMLIAFFVYAGIYVISVIFEFINDKNKN